MQQVRIDKLVNCRCGGNQNTHGNGMAACQLTCANDVLSFDPITEVNTVKCAVTHWNQMPLIC